MCIRKLANVSFLFPLLLNVHTEFLKKASKKCFLKRRAFSLASNFQRSLNYELTVLKCGMCDFLPFKQRVASFSCPSFPSLSFRTCVFNFLTSFILFVSLPIKDRTRPFPHSVLPLRHVAIDDGCWGKGRKRGALGPGVGGPGYGLGVAYTD